LTSEAAAWPVDGRVVKEGEWLSLDGSTGEIFVGELPSVAPDLAEQQSLSNCSAGQTRYGDWESGRTRTTRATRSAPAEFGAEGIGLCRTEHMFMEEDRLPLVQQMILAAPEARAREAKLQA